MEPVDRTNGSTLVETQQSAGKSIRYEFMAYVMDTKLQVTVVRGVYLLVEVSWLLAV